MRTNNRSGKTLEERFWEKVDRGEPDECWEWQAVTGTGGYGQIYADGQQRSSHRVSYWLEHGENPGEDWVLHHCDNKPCVNPNHLYLGDRSDNVNDMFERGQKTHDGENNPNVILSEDSVHEICERVSDGDSQYDIADDFGVSQSTVTNIVKGRRWGDKLPDGWEWESEPKSGEENPNSKLNEEKVREIRERSENGESYGEIASDYDVSKSTIGKVVRRERWSEID